MLPRCQLHITAKITLSFVLMKKENNFSRFCRYRNSLLTNVIWQKIRGKNYDNKIHEFQPFEFAWCLCHEFSQPKAPGSCFWRLKLVGALSCSFKSLKCSSILPHSDPSDAAVRLRIASISHKFTPRPWRGGYLCKIPKEKKPLWTYRCLHM